MDWTRGLDSWTGLWTEIWTGFWTDMQFNDNHFQHSVALNQATWGGAGSRDYRLCTSNCLPKTRLLFSCFEQAECASSLPLSKGSFKIRHKH